MNTDPELELYRLKLAIPFLASRGFEHNGNNAQWLFAKGGKLYDLSAADLEQLDRIERKGLFVMVQ